jgi:hypothetical protein
MRILRYVGCGFNLAKAELCVFPGLGKIPPLRLG